MSLQRFLIVSSLIIAPITTFAFEPAAFAGTDSTNIIIGGTVAPVIDIEATPTAAAQQLPLSDPGPKIVKIADLTLTSNNYSGVTVTATSTNEGLLLDSNNPEISVSYQIDLVSDNTAPGDFRSLNTFNHIVSIPETDLYIQVNNPSLPIQGNYGDTITITVADN